MPKKKKQAKLKELKEMFLQVKYVM